MQTYPINSTNQKVHFGLRYRFNIPNKEAEVAISDFERIIGNIDVPIFKLKTSQAALSLKKGINIVSFSDKNRFDVFINEKVTKKPKEVLNINHSGDFLDFVEKQIKPLFLVSTWCNILINNIWSFLDKIFAQRWIVRTIC